MAFYTAFFLVIRQTTGDKRSMKFSPKGKHDMATADWGEMSDNAFLRHSRQVRQPVLR